MAALLADARSAPPARLDVPRGRGRHRGAARAVHGRAGTGAAPARWRSPTRRLPSGTRCPSRCSPRDDLAEIEALYAAPTRAPGSYRAAPRDRPLRRGQREAGELVCIAGVHVHSPALGVAALGNVATLPDLRGRGLARGVCAALCDAPARRRHRRRSRSTSARTTRPRRAAYTRIGFDRRGAFAESTLARRDARRGDCPLSGARSGARAAARRPPSTSATRRASGPEALEPVDEDVAVPLDALVAAVGEQQRLVADDRPVPLVDVLRDDQVDLAALVLEQHEDDAVRGRGPLPRDREPGVGDPSSRAARRAARRSRAFPPADAGAAA